MILPRIILVACMISAVGQVYAALPKKEVEKRPLVFNVTNQEVEQCCKQLSREVGNACYFAEKNLEKRLCSYCCGSSITTKKYGINQRVIHHYSCCCAYKAIELVKEDSNKLTLREHFWCEVSPDYQMPVLCCCIRQARITINWGAPPPPGKPSKPLAAYAKRD